MKESLARLRLKSVDRIVFLRLNGAQSILRGYRNYFSTAIVSTTLYRRGYTAQSQSTSTLSRFTVRLAT
jgi:hypothetical protein